MSKKKTTSHSHLMSPENYIRQKSRNLPLGECFISKNWRESNMGNIIITRKHITGNVTACLYLVDLGCLGVKDTDYRFNVPFDEIEEIVKDSEEQGAELIKASYVLVHNIIHAAVEFAGDYGFKPCKEFTSITSYFLEEDTDKIPLMEIKCGGKDGNPIYINTGFESPARVQEIVNTLKKTAGEGNYNYLLREDDLFEDEYDEDEEEDSEYSEIKWEISALDKEERKKRLFELIKQKSNEKKSQTAKDIIRFTTLIDFVAYDLVNAEDFEAQFNMLEKNLSHEIIENDELPNSLFTGIQDMDVDIPDLFLNTVMDDKNPKKALAAFRTQAGDIPAADFLELLYLKINKKQKKYNARLEEYARKHPNYFLIQLLNYTDIIQGNRKGLEKLLSEKTDPITEYEFKHFLFLYFLLLNHEDNADIAFVLAFEEYIISSDDVSEATYENMLPLIKLFKMNTLIRYFEQNGEL